ncbi:MAG: hypothetical protein AB1704_39565 [Pseudomonadota bacterium]|jgi:hypothetical protein|uniref:hypothetical protein n=1 Tax=Burkholderiaceae TaxID=119060 RepID=UPI0014858924|nr:hypothetical protein [Burkholderia sp. 4M9327F10]
MENMFHLMVRLPIIGNVSAAHRAFVEAVLQRNKAAEEEPWRKTAQKNCQASKI